jgi:transcriptional regulator with XRE-family HTH domain
MSEAHTAFAERLIQVLKREGKPTKPAALARAFTSEHWGDGISLHGARKWLCGEAIPTQDKLETLARWLRISAHELRYGVESTKRIERKINLIDEAGTAERQSIEKFLALPAEQRKTVSAVIEAFAIAQAQAAA